MTPPNTFEQAQQAKQLAVDALMDWPEVCGIGVAPHAEGWAVKVNLRHKLSAALPAEFLGVPVVSEVVGEISAADFGEAS